tara:strand:+ start:11476 stop:12480 length:1005 start_codon:yes stop_codon:yes gene_type:complete
MLTSISLFTSANAGELSVTGTAKASYNIVSGDVNIGKGLGVANEFDLGASGELDNGWTWNYQVQMDPAATTTPNDDSKLTITSPFGTVGIFMSEGGLDVEDSASQGVYARATDTGDPSATVDNYDIDGTNNIQYHTPAGLFPYGIAIKGAYSPNANQTMAGANGTGTGDTQTLNSATSMGLQIKAAPMDGLAIGASAVKADGGSTSASPSQVAQSVAAFGTYAIGSVTLGYSYGHNQPAITTQATTSAESYEQQNGSIGFAVNDNLSVSFEQEVSEVSYIASTTAKVKQKSSAIQAAYTMGGMTMAVSQGAYDNVGYVDSKNASQTLFAVTMAF